MSQPAFDIAVVGAGPAGAMAAYECARHGLRTVLVEKEHLPRRKVCGGGLSSKSLSILPFSPQPVMEQHTVAGWVAYGDSRAIEVKVRQPGMMVCRESFDAFLAEQAVGAGANLIEGFELNTIEQGGDALVLTSGQGVRITARITIAADGVNSTIRRQRFPESRPTTVAALEARVAPSRWARERLAERCLFDFGAVEAGYAWIFPKRDHLNVGVYRFRKTPRSRDLQAVLAAFLASNSFLRGARLLDTAGAMIPVSLPEGSLVRGGVVLAGDAAGFGDALFGEGIYYALRSGREAGTAAVNHLMRAVPLTGYDRRVRILRRQLRAAVATAGFVYRFPRFAFERMAGSPFACRLFAGVVTGEVSPVQCLLRASGTAPYWFLARRRPVGHLPVQELEVQPPTVSP
jgi:geranylgeranyl reductase family protein